MAKGQKRGNREDRKPKMNKPKVVATAAPALAKGLLPRPLFRSGRVDRASGDTPRQCMRKAKFAVRFTVMKSGVPNGHKSASRELVCKPWGSVDLRPWSKLDTKGEAVGEIWFGRADGPPPEPALLLKLLFTRERLSIQVHPDDTFARSAGLANGKTEAWYVVEAEAMHALRSD